MTLRDRYLTKNFRESEFRCKCRRPECDAPPMQPGFMAKLQMIRDALGKPILILSGSRCSAWNKKVGGAPLSQHRLGNAADLGFDSQEDADTLIATAEEFGMGGIGISKVFIHVDDGVKGRRWVYS